MKMGIRIGLALGIAAISSIPSVAWSKTSERPPYSAQLIAAGSGVNLGCY